MSRTKGKKGSKFQKKKFYSWEDLLKFENKDRYSSIGKKILSSVKNQPSYSIGSSLRKQYRKQYFNNELSKDLYGNESIFKIFERFICLIVIGLNSKGPKYNVTDKYDYKR